MNRDGPSEAPLAPTPVPGTAAHWAAQREAFALIEDWQTTDPGDPWAELAALRRIAAHPFAAGVMHARGRDFAPWISELEGIVEGHFWGRHAMDDEDWEPETQPKGADWCPHGCQPLHHLGECGMCGYEGRGVATSATRTVAEYCPDCNCRTYQSRDGICELCSRDAEVFGRIEPAAPITGPGAGTGAEQGPCIPACCHEQPFFHGACACGAEAVDSDGQCCLCGYLESRAALDAMNTPAAAPATHHEAP